MIQLQFLVTKLLFFYFVFLLATLFSKPLQGQELAAPHHYFNARLLEEGEHQVNIIVNYKYGLNKRLEIGSQGLGLVYGAPNFYFKHKMFEHPNGQTSAVGHLFFMNDKLSLANSDSKVFQIWGPVGLVHSFSIDQRHEIGLGIHNIFFRTPFSKETDANLNITALSFSYDYILSNSIYFNFVLAPPLWIYGRVEDTFSEMEVSSLLIAHPSGRNLMLGYATIVAQVTDSTHVEGGFIHLIGSINPYLNIFWRFK